MVEHARVHPKFLHSNATSHKWAFGGKAMNILCFSYQLVERISFVMIMFVLNRSNRRAT